MARLRIDPEDEEEEEFPALERVLADGMKGNAKVKTGAGSNDRFGVSGGKGKENRSPEKEGMAASPRKRLVRGTRSDTTVATFDSETAPCDGWADSPGNDEEGDHSKTKLRARSASPQKRRLVRGLRPETPSPERPRQVTAPQTEGARKAGRRLVGRRPLGVVGDNSLLLPLGKEQRKDLAKEDGEKTSQFERRAVRATPRRAAAVAKGEGVRSRLDACFSLTELSSSSEGEEEEEESDGMSDFIVDDDEVEEAASSSEEEVELDGKHKASKPSRIKSKGTAKPSRERKTHRRQQSEEADIFRSIRSRVASSGGQRADAAEHRNLKGSAPSMRMGDLLSPDQLSLEDWRTPKKKSDLAKAKGIEYGNPFEEDQGHFLKLQSTDAFWSQTQHHAWIETHSPSKTIPFTPRKLFPPDHLSNATDLDSLSSPLKPSPQKNKAELAAKRAFDATKHALAASFLQELDEKLTDGQVGRMAASGGGVRIEWSKKLTSTGGRAHWSRSLEKPRTTSFTTSSSSSTPSSTSTSTTANTTPPPQPSPTKPHPAPQVYKHTASIELSTKIVTNPLRLHNVLAHEFCHLANFMISHVLTSPHGPSFKAWGRRASAAFAHLGVVVTTTHAYEVEYRYLWRCTRDGCAMEFGRHSRSVDPKKHTCGRCRGRLVQVRPAPRVGAAGVGVAAAAGKGGRTGMQVGLTPYQAFVRDWYAVVKKEHPRVPHAEVMRRLGERYRALKAAGEAGDEVGRAAEEGEGGEEEEEEMDGGVGDVDSLPDALGSAEDGLDGMARELGWLSLD
ncbi:MAG: hypothetical protein M1824_002403 [Vezdaea acicularis]|nr:MAG: hypothetical protein M1824_002403 [Vezdaea acicularis]